MTTSQAQCEANCPPPTPASDANRCLFITSDGRQCRLTRSPHHDALCPAHARKEEHEAHSQFAGGLNPELSAELAPLSGSFRTANDVNRALGKLFLLVAQGRIPRRDAMALGYLAQLLIQTLPATQREIREVLGFPQWCEIVRSAIPDDSEEDDDEEEEAEESATPIASSSTGTPACAPAHMQAQNKALEQGGSPSIRSSLVPSGAEGGPPGAFQPGDPRLVSHAAMLEPATAEWSEPAESCDTDVILTFPEFTVMDQRNSLLLAQERAQAAKAAKAADAATDSQAQSGADQARAEFLKILLSAARLPATSAKPSQADKQPAPSLPPPKPQTATPPAALSQAALPQPAQNQKPEPLVTFRMPGLNGTMQELQVTASSAEAAFAPRLPPHRRP